MRSNDPLRRSGRPGRSNSVLVSWVRGVINRNPVSGSLALNARMSSILNLISVSTAEGIEKDYSCENLKTFNTAWRSHNQSPIFSTETHHGGLAARRPATAGLQHGDPKKNRGKTKSNGKTQNQNPRTAEKAENCE